MSASALRIAIERRASATTAGEQELLLVKLNAGAVEQINKGDAQYFCSIRSLEQVFRLTGNPCAGSFLVVGCHDNSPLTRNAANSFHYAG